VPTFIHLGQTSIHLGQTSIQYEELCTYKITSSRLALGVGVHWPVCRIRNRLVDQDRAPDRAWRRKSGRHAGGHSLSRPRSRRGLKNTEKLRATPQALALDCKSVGGSTETTRPPTREQQKSACGLIECVYDNYGRAGQSPVSLRNWQPTGPYLTNAMIESCMI
jgi:hypothetical protein